MPQKPTHPDAPRTAADPYLMPALGVGLMFVLTAPVMMAIVAWAGTVEPPSSAFAVSSGGAPAADLGTATFNQSCAVCHSPTADGIPGLGKPLRNSAFVQSQSDEELISMVVDGRAPTDPLNTTGVAMYPRAGNPALSDDAIHAVVGYLRSIQDPDAPHAALDPWIIAPPGADESGEVAIGQTEFIASCSACHGRTGEGVENLGKPLAGSEFIQSKTDKELTTFVKTGRPIWDAANTTGLDMPSKGGNPALSDEDLSKIIQYIRSRQADG